MVTRLFKNDLHQNLVEIFRKRLLKLKSYQNYQKSFKTFEKHFKENNERKLIAKTTTKKKSTFLKHILSTNAFVKVKRDNSKNIEQLI